MSPISLNFVLRFYLLFVFLSFDDTMMMFCSTTSQVTRLGFLWKVFLGEFFLMLEAKISGDLFGLLENQYYLSKKLLWLLFRQILERIGQLLISSSCRRPKMNVHTFTNAVRRGILSTLEYFQP